MTAKEIFKEYRDLKRRIEQLEFKRCELRTLAESCTVDPTQEKVQSSSNPDPVGSAVSKIADIDAEIEDIKNQAADVLDMLDKYMRDMDDEKQWQVLIMRYFKDASWSETAATVGVSPRYVVVLHDKAIQSLDKIILNKDI